ncbi:16S rRNA (guanine(1207)-N(2))-methyltransferase RsmC [Pasteurellaceae bacterium HPA106]|uniref:16S rRNA (guanine(1207)-N(2))-methyltransferase RsmC n=1 Tax=Spirabiliibacterium pneumoniae TaxID=221400 RepID=UPI001AAD343C|nr:16S rRNA (guanine(1207)-N(2))-methyltransferase RsmC [Spirabiliibacterium pneumoniae]MBE2896267.1 16S rRNA (guanine(1207)-N(2))-methyltransferase RsmC [Spirabiliibacterium pneumoniae]
MLSVESQVLTRHRDLLAGKSLHFAGFVRDDFPCQQISQSAVSLSSVYFDYVHQASTLPNVHFGLPAQWQAEVLVYYWGKNKQEVRFELTHLLSLADVGQRVLIVGENRAGVRSVESLLAPFGAVQKIDSARRCGLYHFTLERVPTFSLDGYWRCYTPANLAGLRLFSLPGVFSAGELDAGTALLLSTLQSAVKGRVLDVGCGAGVIGAYIKQKNPAIELVQSDIHAMAIASSQRTLVENGLHGEVVASDVFSHIEGKFNLIISNPPFHDGVDTAYAATERLIAQSKAHLYSGGELRLVANAFLPYPDMLARAFGRVEVLAQSSKFKVYRAFA